jgi:hypothetical protein
MFSGRQNPSFALTTGDRIVIEGLLASSSLVPERSGGEPDLGYRGFRVEWPETEIMVFGGVVRITVNGDTSYRDDLGQLLETYLVGAATAHLPPDLVQFITISRRSVPNCIP